MTDPPTPKNARTRPEAAPAARERVGGYAVHEPQSDAPSPPTGARTIDDPVVEMRKRSASKQYEGCLAMADLILSVQPDHALARRYRANCCAALEGLYTSRLAPLERVPVHVVSKPNVVEASSVDHRAEFVLSLVDGVASLESILRSCGMPRSDVLRILHEFVELKIIAFR